LVEAGKGSLHPWSLLTAVIPHLYGISRPLSDYWGPPSPDWGPVDLYLARNMATFYFGMVPVLALALVPLLWRFRARFAGSAQPDGVPIDPHRGDGMFLFAAFVALMLFSLGRYTPFFGFVFQVVPGIDRFRRPADGLFVACALASMAAGYGVHRWLQEPGFRLSAFAKGVAAAIFATLLIAGCVLAHKTGKLSVSAMPITASICFSAAAVLTLVILRRLRDRAILAAAVAAVAITADLGWNNAPNESTGLTPETYDVLRPDTGNATIAMLKDLTAQSRGPDRIDRVELAGIEFHWPNATLTHKLHHTLGYNPVRSALLSKGYGAGDHIALPDQKMFTPLNTSYRSLMTDMIGLRYIATRVPLGELDPKATGQDFPLVGRTQDAFVHENPRALPRVLFASHARQADFDALIATGRWPEDFDPRETVLLDRLINPTETDMRPGSRSVRIVSYRNAEVVIEARSESGGFVVLNDSWDDWWRVEVNGAPAEIERANVMFRAVAVPAGTATVRFVYRPFRGALGEVLRRK
jgi:hypothetical protein